MISNVVNVIEDDIQIVFRSLTLLLLSSCIHLRLRQLFFQVKANSNQIPVVCFIHALCFCPPPFPYLELSVKWKTEGAIKYVNINAQLSVDEL